MKFEENWNESSAKSLNNIFRVRFSRWRLIVTIRVVARNISPTTFRVVLTARSRG